MSNLLCCNFSLVGRFVVSHYDAFFVVLIACDPIDAIFFPRCCMFLRLLVTGNVYGGNWEDRNV